VHYDCKHNIKDGGANDTDGDQTDNTGNANGVIASTISIAVPPTTNSSGGGGGGGCVYNPNAPAKLCLFWCELCY
jgi:hypothetical protein